MFARKKSLECSKFDLIAYFESTSLENRKRKFLNNGRVEAVEFVGNKLDNADLVRNQNFLPESDDLDAAKLMARTAKAITLYAIDDVCITYCSLNK